MSELRFEEIECDEDFPSESIGANADIARRTEVASVAVDLPSSATENEKWLSLFASAALWVQAEYAIRSTTIGKPQWAVTASAIASQRCSLLQVGITPSGAKLVGNLAAFWAKLTVTNKPTVSRLLQAQLKNYTDSGVAITQKMLEDDFVKLKGARVKAIGKVRAAITPNPVALISQKRYVNELLAIFRPFVGSPATSIVTRIYYLLMIGVLVLEGNFRAAFEMIDEGYSANMSGGGAPKEIAALPGNYDQIPEETWRKEEQVYQALPISKPE
jgi:hypothetical protein